MAADGPALRLDAAAVLLHSEAPQAHSCREAAAEKHLSRSSNAGRENVKREVQQKQTIAGGQESQEHHERGEEDSAVHH